ncbi:16S rRNA (guanine(966)-N(2))-methyltransferase RsmD [Balneolales bacterium ANBcel1]|nr:16S rRNA (guanine(966)-N(2))-methyltransferase RsmD [Balneolales bacterium ANBcel1]
MRIITGTLKGRRFAAPKNVEIRPTSDRTKESMFAVIEVRKHIAGSDVLDLFAGTGNLGFEAISRGAERVCAVEASPKAVENLEKQASRFGIDKKVQSVCSTVEAWLRNPGQPYDLVFADPPYDYAHMVDLPEIIIHNGWLKEDGWFLLEHDKRHNFVDHPHCAFSKPYGRTIVTIFTRDPVSKT